MSPHRSDVDRLGNNMLTLSVSFERRSRPTNVIVIVHQYSFIHSFIHSLIHSFTHSPLSFLLAAQRVYARHLLWEYDRPSVRLSVCLSHFASHS